MKRILKGMIRLYQSQISPALGPSKCRFTPTCSSYALESIEVHGAIRGSFMAIWRVLRCNPWGKGGYDPVPARKNDKEYR